jgi:hypothetical protein
MRPYDSVTLLVDLPEVPAGTSGAIVEQYSDGKGFEVEFFDNDGKTIDVATVVANQIRVTLSDFFPDEQVALLEDLPMLNLKRGQVGKIVQRTSVGHYLVAFSANDTPIILHASQLLLLIGESSLATDDVVVANPT